jgi:hypothetical protein
LTVDVAQDVDGDEGVMSFIDSRSTIKIRRALVLKSVLFAGAMIVAGPAIAQEGKTPQPIAPTSAPGAATVPASPSETAQSSNQPAATASRAADGDQMTTIIDAEFPAYDKDGTGALDKTEFAAWMDALKAKAPDGAKPSDAKWNEAAFAQADKDKSASINKDELTGFLRG